MNPSNSIGRLAVATVLPVFGLFILRLILVSLPMIKNAGPLGDTGVAPLLLVKAVIDTLIYVLIFRFCWASGEVLKIERPHLAELAAVLMLSGFALVATLAYSGYERLMLALAPTQMELYNWLFLAAVLFPVGMIIVLVVRRMDFYTDIVFGGIQRMPQAAMTGPGAGPAVPFGAAPPNVPPPAVQNAEDAALRNRVNQLRQIVSSALSTAQQLQTQGRMSGELAESPQKMQGYLDGAIQSLANGDLKSAKGFADWAEYEASRLLQAGK